jgi:SOS-response transcriptional repressor LexA
MPLHWLAALALNEIVEARANERKVLLNPFMFMANFLFALIEVTDKSMSDPGVYREIL